MLITGAEIIIKTLIEQGCKTVFGYPGGQVLNIYDELYKYSNEINHIIAAHEQGAVHAADGFARVTGEVGVCIATSGPGATNLVTGIANAQLDSIPLVAITGNVPMDLMGRDSFQEVDIMGITMPITKHNYVVKDIALLADTIREAFQIAKSGRPGPVLIDVPKNVQIATYDYENGEVVEPIPSKTVNQQEIDKAVELIDNAKKPYIYIGGGVISSNAYKEVIELSEKIDAPIGSSMMGLGAVPNSYKNFLGMQGMHGKFASSKAMANSDLIITLGARFSDRATGNKAKFAKKAQIIHIDIEPAELSKNIPVELGLIGDMKNAISRIIEGTKPSNHCEWLEEVAEFKKRDEKVKVDPNSMRPYAIVDTVCQNASPDAIIATDVGQHQMWTAQRYGFSQPRTFVTSGGLGTMGFGLGAAIGACMGSKKQTILFTGDGSFGMNLNEMATLVSNDLPLVVIVMNNGVLGMVRQWQTLFYNQHYSSTTLNRQTDFVKLAEAFGAKGYRADDKQTFDKVLKEALSLKKPALIDCHIDMDEMVLPMTPPGGSIKEVIVTRDEIKM